MCMANNEISVVGGDPLSGTFILNFRGKEYELKASEELIKIMLPQSTCVVAHIIKGSVTSGAIFVNDQVVAEYFPSSTEKDYIVTRVKDGVKLSETTNQHPILFVLDELNRASIF